MVRFVGFFRPVRGVSFRGDVGAENAWELSNPGAVDGRGRATAFMFSDKFLTFFVVSIGRGGCIEGACGIMMGGSF